MKQEAGLVDCRVCKGAGIFLIKFCSASYINNLVVNLRFSCCFAYLLLLINAEGYGTFTKKVIPDIENI